MLCLNLFIRINHSVTLAMSIKSVSIASLAIVPIKLVNNFKLQLQTDNYTIEGNAVFGILPLFIYFYRHHQQKPC